MRIDIEFNSGAQLPMDAIPGLARLAEAHGFGCAWAGEANNKDPTVMLAAIAAVTNRLQIGSAVYHILGRTPATLALQAVGLDELSGGRFLLGIGVSNPSIARWHGLPFDHPLGRVASISRSTGTLSRTSATPRREGSRAAPGRPAARRSARDG